MLRLLILIFVCCSTAYTIHAEDPHFHSVKVEKGEGVFALLNKYELFGYKCNLEAFYKINDLTEDDFLLTGVKYKLPIRIFNYNGKSIRSTIQNQDYEKAVRIQKYNELILAKGLRKTDYRESNILWVPLHEIACEEEIIDVKKVLVKSDNDVSPIVTKASNKSRNRMMAPLLGDKYKSVNLIDHSLKNQVFYLVSGHGGPDPGALCKDCPSDMCEDEYAYDVTLRLARNLMQHGATVHMIIKDDNDGIRDESYLKCDKDETTLTGAKLPLRQLDRLKQRSDAINKLYYKHKKEKVKKQQVVFIHVDSRGKDKRQDVFFYYYGKRSKGKKLAYNMHSVFEEKYNQYQKGRGYKGYVDNRGLYVLRKTIPSAVYVELANIRNKQDHKRLIYKENRQALANWLYEGLIKE